MGSVGAIGAVGAVGAVVRGVHDTSNVFQYGNSLHEIGFALLTADCGPWTADFLMGAVGAIGAVVAMVRGVQDSSIVFL